MIEARYDYAGPYRSSQRANDVLEHMFASDQVSEGERPLIEGRAVRGTKGIVRRWYITLPM